MDNSEQGIIQRAFNNSMEELTGSRIKPTCHTRDETKELGKWKGTPNKNT